MAEGAEDRSEAASPRRLEKAREEGQTAVSRELAMLASLVAGIVALAAEAHTSREAGRGVGAWLAGVLSRPAGDPAEALRTASRDLLAAAAPVWLAAAGAFSAVTMLQTGFLVRLASLQPDIARLSPLRGAKRMFGTEALGQTAKAIAKLAVLACCLTLALQRLIPSLEQAPLWQPALLLHQIVRQGSLLLLLIMGAHAAIAAADVAWVRLQHAKRLRMSRQEVRDEQKESDGNPQVKQRLRQIARQRAKRRMMAAVPKAAVIITNPTHYAVALAYDRGQRAAPRLVAKGADDIAARIREIAREARIPIVANPPLARALYHIDIDTEIPAEHFRAVAEIIAYIWRMRAHAATR